MTALGYVNNANYDANGEFTRLPNAAGEFTAINPEWLSFDVATNLRILVAALFLVSAVLQFIGLALVYNLDKKTLDKMNTELAEKRAAGEAEAS